MEENNNFGNNQNSDTESVSLSKEQPQQSDTAATGQQGTTPSFAQVVQNYQQSGTNAGQQGGMNSPFGAQNQTYTGGYQGGGMPMGTPQPPKKSKAGIIFAVAAVVAVVLVGVLAWRVFRDPLAGTDPQKLYEQGMDIMAKEMETYNSSISEDIGFDEITAFQRENPMQFQADMTFVLPESYDYENIDFDINMDLVTDWKNKKASAELGVGAYGMTLPIGELVTDGASNSIFFQCPIVSEEVYSVELTDFGKKFNESAWARFLESELPEDYTMELFSENMEAAETEQSQAELSDIFAKFTDALQSARELTAVREKKAVWIGDKEVKCSGVAIRIPKESINEYLKSLKDDIMGSQYYQEVLDSAAARNALSGVDLEKFKQEADEMMELFLGLQLEEDFVCHTYFDAKGRIVNISTPQDIPVEGDGVDAIAMDFNFTGEERAMDTISGRFYFKSSSDEVYIGIDRSAKVSEEWYKEDIELSLGETGQVEDLIVKYKNDWNYQEKSFDILLALEAESEELSISGSGEFQNIEKGKGYTLKLDNVTLNIDDEDLLIMSGSIATEPTDKEVEVPALSIDFLDMSMEDIEALINGTDAPTYY